uniref:Uncharacterized protein n=1 Tax=Glossina pallidipes TaxID=7398 RepID=A0A1B0A9K5_GLOPL
MEIIGLQALLTLVFLLVLPENNCHGGRSLHYCANWSPSPFDGIGRYIYLSGSPPDGPNPCVKPGYDDNGYFVWLHGYLKNGYAYRDNDQSSGTHPCRSVRIDNRMGHYFSVSGFPSVECADWMPGYDGNKGHYERKKGKPPKDPCVRPDHDKSGYYIWRHGFLRLNRSRLMRNGCWVYKFSSNDGYYISEGGETPREDDPCARYAGNEKPGQNGTGGYYRWEHGYVACMYLY